MIRLFFYISVGELVAYESILHFWNLWVYWHVNCFMLYGFNSEDKKYGKLKCRNYCSGKCRRPIKFTISLTLYCKSSICMDANKKNSILGSFVFLYNYKYHLIFKNKENIF
ncbi:hypothetical protein AAZV13_16G074000 [Glycine max]